MLIKGPVVCFWFLQSCFSDRKKASNLEAYVEWFNRLSYLVATEICMVSPEPGAGVGSGWGGARTLREEAGVDRSFQDVTLRLKKADRPFSSMSSCSQGRRNTERGSSSSSSTWPGSASTSATSTPSWPSYVSSASGSFGFWIIETQPSDFCRRHHLLKSHNIRVVRGGGIWSSSQASGRGGVLRAYGQH